ncbi:MBL fold metallo-hydrolase [Acidithiobacillus ferrooxidans]|nr:MBL fold metallo-hydrolase [Acidithiobacillus ferrooxidans]
MELQDSSQYLDMVIISHFHSDHINGLPLLFKKFKIKN